MKKKSKYRIVEHPKGRFSVEKETKFWLFWKSWETVWFAPALNDMFVDQILPGLVWVAPPSYNWSFSSFEEAETALNTTLVNLAVRNVTYL